MSDQYKGMPKRGKNTKFDFLQISNITLDESWSKCRLVSQKNEALNKAKTAQRVETYSMPGFDMYILNFSLKCNLHALKKMMTFSLSDKTIVMTL